MRLIDADAFEKEIVEFYESSLNDHDANLFVEFMAHLDEQPTAYDVEKVVEQLETHKDLDVCENNCYECKKKYPNDDCPTEKCAFDKAIEIVRKGGVE